jgi:hypothetical protein
VRTLHRHRQHLCLPHHQAVNNANVPILPLHDHSVFGGLPTAYETLLMQENIRLGRSRTDTGRAVESHCIDQSV